MKKTAWISFAVAYLILIAPCLAADLELSFTDQSVSETGFGIERADALAGPYKEIARPGASASSGAVVKYVDGGLPEAKYFCYRLFAFNNAGKSAYAGPVCGRTNATLTIVKTGTGAGTVTGALPVLSTDCGKSICVASVPGNAYIMLTVKPAAGSTFEGWGGACFGTRATCSVTMNQARNVIAMFTLTVPNRPTELGMLSR